MNELMNRLINDISIIQSTSSLINYHVKDLYKGASVLSTAHPYRSDYLLFFFFGGRGACLSACSAEKWGPFLDEDFFYLGGGGGACQLNI